MRMRVKKGLNLPLEGSPTGGVQSLPPPKQLALNLDPFDTVRFKVLVRLNDVVKVGQPLVESKTSPGMNYVSPAGGRVVEIRRGVKRRLLDIVIEVAEKEEHQPLPPLKSYTKEEVIERLNVGGGFPHIRMRPFDLVALPTRLPQSIFVKAVESAPFTPAAELQVEGHEEDFEAGLRVLSTVAPVHLVYREGSSCTGFTKGDVHEKHSISGFHPAGNVSVHIHQTKPIVNHKEVVWTLSVIDVITVGKLVEKGLYNTDRVIGVGGSGLKEAGYFKGRAGYPICDLAGDRMRDELLCLISGDPLAGARVELDGFLGFYHTVFSALPLSVKREMLHFFRLGWSKFSATRTYLSGFFKKKSYRFTTNQHGEERAFIDGAVYNKMMPMQIPTIQLIKAVLSEDFELAEQLGLLEVAPEDFALPAFICPSKIDMIEIMKQGLHQYSKELGF
ncbi:MAG: Na(+)-translocating NADH-quinone reductase subunit A [Chlamydiales bacterium]|nr:Na(+)-translocating NADH-quinone reductase subunit A [Chlamydiales bacterium]MCH9619567.1 Na(+)-translocating NADH-quinone reductase subunit A [Chlamydiales bacterium]MCH9623173.1 Na(+)-translocating NADH-quinone reductase subunit A [Chlamydiales bacterium]